MARRGGARPDRALARVICGDVVAAVGEPRDRQRRGRRVVARGDRARLRDAVGADQPGERLRLVAAADDRDAGIVAAPSRRSGCGGGSASSRSAAGTRPARAAPPACRGSARADGGWASASRRPRRRWRDAPIGYGGNIRRRTRRGSVRLLVLEAVDRAVFGIEHRPAAAGLGHRGRASAARRRAPARRCRAARRSCRARRGGCWRNRGRGGGRSARPAPDG